MNERRHDFELLQRFARHGEQAAFADVVRRHLDLVFATALRKLEDPGAAQEVAQNVFAALARKAWHFAPDDSLPAWLHKTALLESKSFLRGELRRRRREQTAAELGTTMKTPDEQTAFNALVPLLDDALLSLREKDRTALLLRFYESQSLRDVGASLGVGEDVAQKRVQNALEKLSQFFQRRGFRTATVAASAAALQHTATSASAATAAVVVNGVLQSAPPAVVGLTALVARLVSLTKVQTAAVCLAVAAVPVGWQWHEHRSATTEAERIQTQLLTVQNESATIQREIERLRVSSEKLQAALANAGENGVHDSDEARKFEAWKAKIRAGLMAADYRWPEDSPFVRIPKSALKQITPRSFSPVGPPGVVSSEARELLGLTPPEREQLEASLRQHFSAMDGLIENHLYETNKASLDTGTSHVPMPKAALASKVWVIPTLGEEAKTRGEELQSAMEGVLGEERWPLVKTQLGSRGVGTLRHVLNLDAGKEGQELGAWISENNGNLVVGYGWAGSSGSSSSGGMALNLFLPVVLAGSGASPQSLLGMRNLPDLVRQRVTDWIRQQAVSRLGEESAR